MKYCVQLNFKTCLNANIILNNVLARLSFHNLFYVRLCTACKWHERDFLENVSKLAFLEQFQL